MQSNQIRSPVVVLAALAYTARQSDKPVPTVSGSLCFDSGVMQGGQTSAFATTHFTP